MSTPERADPFAADDLDVSGFAPAAEKPAPPARAVIRKISEENNFPSRAPAVLHAPPKAQRRRRTGRNAQVNIKATQETIDLHRCNLGSAKTGHGRDAHLAPRRPGQSLTRLQATS
jgi:hypothetical protein